MKDEMNKVYGGKYAETTPQSLKYMENPDIRS
jgi:hypothetical protein